MPLEGVARTEWDRITSECFWLTESDSGTLADRCVCYARMLEAEADVQRRGMLIGRKKTANPSVRLARQYRAAVSRYDAQLGLVAAAREGIAARGQHDADYIDPLEAALSWPFGFTSARIWKVLRRGKPDRPTTPAELRELAADRLESDRRMIVWKESHSIPADIDTPVPAPSHGASQEEFQRYHAAKLEQQERIVAACRAAGLDPQKC